MHTVPKTVHVASGGRPAPRSVYIVLAPLQYVVNVFRGEDFALPSRNVVWRVMGVTLSL